MKRKAAVNFHSDDQGLENGNEGGTSIRGRRNNVNSERMELHGLKPTLPIKGKKLKQISSDKIEVVNENLSENIGDEVSLESKVVLKGFDIKLSRCDEVSDGVNYSKQLDGFVPMSKTRQKGLSSGKNRKKMEDSDEATANMQSNEDFDICSTSSIIIDHNSNQIGEIESDSKTVLKTLKNVKEIETENSSKKKLKISEGGIEGQTKEPPEDKIKQKSKTVVKKLKISKGENSSEATENVQNNEDRKPKSKSVLNKLKEPKGGIDKQNGISEADNAEQDEDFELCNASHTVGRRSRQQVNEMNPKFKTAVKKFKSSKESIKEMDEIPKVTESVQEDENFDVCNVSDKVESSRQKDGANSKSRTMVKQLKSSKKGKKEMSMPKATESDQQDEIKPKSKIAVKKLKNSKSIIKGDVSKTSGNLQPDDGISNNDTTKEVQMNNEKQDVQESFETLKYDDSELPVDVSSKIIQVPNEKAKGNNKRKRGKQSEDTEDDAKPTKSAKKEKDSSKSKSSREKIPDVTSIDFSNDSKTESGSMWNFKISSWNTNGIRAWLEKNGLSYVHHEKPDVICIQETKCSDDKLPEEIKKIKGYHTYWLSGDKEGYSGVGLLSKEEPIKVEYGIGISEHDNEGRVITAEYEKFYLVAAYVPNAGRKLIRLEYRMKWDEDFRAYVKKLDDKKPVILCGDLNVAHEEIDLANPKTNKKNAGFTKEEREGFSALLKEGFTDTFRKLYPDLTGAYTFWTYMMNARAKNVGWRLDYFVMSERFTENLCDNVIRKDVFGSDHCPITLFLSL